MRLFVAIELADAAKSKLSELQARLGRDCQGVRWIPREQLHLTVKFLGEVPDGRVPEVCAGLSTAALDCRPFAMGLEGAGCFPPRGSVRIVWAGLLDASGQLRLCVESVESAMEILGYAGESKPFSPHITIGRVREDRSGGAIRQAVSKGNLARLEQPVTSFTLMSSVLAPQGPTYTAVCRVPLGPTEGASKERS